jgi:hypothetical protein
LRHVHRWHLSTKIERVSETSVLQTVSFDDDGPVIVSDYSVENARKIGELLIEASKGKPGDYWTFSVR